jgi:hypothetical protein
MHSPSAVGGATHQWTLVLRPWAARGANRDERRNPSGVGAGAGLLRPATEDPEPDRRWDVLADPEGSEFCVFPG